MVFDCASTKDLLEAAVKYFEADVIKSLETMKVTSLSWPITFSRLVLAEGYFSL